MVALKKLPPTSTDLEAWLASLPVHWSQIQVELIRRAYARADQACRSRAPQDRQSCLLAALAVADILADLRLDHEVIAACLLREAVDSGGLDPAALANEFGASVRRLVEGTSRLEGIGDFHQQGHHAHRQLESLRKMLLAMAEDVRVVLIVLAIRLYRMRNLDALPEE
ncbi:MAG: HD domain-containing protein, partial [Candidatus Competibacteraceae bacterium]|nr:HD domain-containing protein [Candidatus Competibacteraceae bacterium]